MSKPTPKDHRTEAIVLRRINFGEADRILDLITPNGLVAVMAKGVRREKSKLAGGIELFSLSCVTYHEGKNLATLTSAKMLNFYQNLTTDLAKMELAGLILKKISRAAEGIEGADYFNLVKDSLESLNSGTAPILVETYFWLNFTKIGGGTINLYYDADGAKLSPAETYSWDTSVEALAKAPRGPISADDIKFLRLMLSSSLKLITKVKYPPAKLPELLYIAKSFAGL